MKHRQMSVSISNNQIWGNAYPVRGIELIAGLLLLSPFFASIPAYAAFAVCLYRLIRYDSKVFCTDFCVLVPLSQLFRTAGGMSLMVYLSLAAIIWFLVRDGIRRDWAFVMLLAVLNYLVLRFQMNITNFLLCFSQLALLWFLMSKQDPISAERSLKAFCICLLFSSVCALLLRNTWQIRALRGAEVPAFFGSSQMRFQGLFSDPNYYMYLLIAALAILIKLYDVKRIRRVWFLIMTVALTVFGILTYSKTFFLMLVVLCAVYIVWQLLKGNYLLGIGLILVIVVSGSFLLFSERSPFAVVLTRLANGSSLSDLTTGRTDLFLLYLNEIFDSPISFLFGKGMMAGNLGMDPHNLYLEIVYYIGVCGLLLFAAYFGTIMAIASRRSKSLSGKDMIARYLVLLMVFLLNFTLHGMYSVATYAGFLLAFLAMLISGEKEVV